LQSASSRRSLAACRFAADKPDYQKLMQDNCAKELKFYCKGVQPRTPMARSPPCTRTDSAGLPQSVLTSVDRLKTAIIALAHVRLICVNEVHNLCPDVVSPAGVI
jgi:hypothetical protein